MYTIDEILNVLPAGSRHVSTDTYADCTHHEFIVNGHYVDVNVNRRPMARVRGYEPWVPLSGVAGFMARYCHI